MSPTKGSLQRLGKCEELGRLVHFRTHGAKENRSRLSVVENLDLLP